MTPAQKIKKTLLIASGFIEETHYEKPLDTPENIEEAYDKADDGEFIDELRYDFRQGDFETGLPCGYSRHYEAKAVAGQMSDGSWVGWTYWFGGGKHGEPGAIDWISDAYDLDLVEAQEMVTVRKWKVIPKA